MDLVVTDKKLDRPGKYVTKDEFLQLAREGIEADGLYIDVDCIDEKLYKIIKDASEGQAVFFTTRDEVPAFVEKYVKFEYEPAKEQVSVSLKDDDFDESLFGKLVSGEEEDSAVDPTSSEPTPSAGDKVAKVYLFGSSKGGTGKTFTCLISAYRYAKLNPDQKVAVADFDVIDGQVGISIHKLNPTLKDFYAKYKAGSRDFSVMQKYKVKSSNFPSNIDFYLAPNVSPIKDDEFWDWCYFNLITNYDVVFFDSGIDYMNYSTISNLYKIADKIILTTTTSIKSVNSVKRQIKRLKGEDKNPVFNKDDKIGDKLHLVITQATTMDDTVNKFVVNAFKSDIHIVAIFGNLTHQIQKAEYLGQWNIFDNIKKFNDSIDKIIQ